LSRAPRHRRYAFSDALRDCPGLRRPSSMNRLQRSNSSDIWRRPATRRVIACRLRRTAFALACQPEPHARECRRERRLV